MDDDELVKNIEAGDGGAFERIYDAYHRFVYGVVYRILETPDETEDVTQAVFLSLWRSPGRFRGGNFRYWIAIVARNRALDARRARHDGHPFGELERSFTWNGAHGDEDDIADRIDAETACKTLASLSNNQRNAIELAFFGGLTHREIAQHTGVPLGTIKTRIRNGLRALRANLEANVRR